jgi:mRNA interferase RelE/StbE
MIEHLEQIESDPYMAGSVKRSGSKTAHRVRVGSYRIVHEVDDAQRVVYVTIIAHLREVYRGL